MRLYEITSGVMRLFKVGAQLIIWGSRVFEDLPLVLNEVSEIGYKGVETGYKAFRDPNSARELLNSRGLELAALHISISDLYDEDALNRCLNIMTEAGSLYLTVSGVGHSSRMNMMDRDIEVLVEAGEKFEDYGIKLCYHNHDWEFHNRVMERLVKETPKYVGLCVDVYWTLCAGYDPVRFIREHIDRVEYLHLKDGRLEDMEKRVFRELGQGIVDFPRILKVAQGKVEWLIIEQDKTDKDPKESMRINFEYVSGLLGSFSVKAK